jgi:alpha-beta hydrolase superfamily lysophospholipase
MSRLDEFYLSSTDGRSKLHVMRWLPDDGHIRAVLQLAHGIAEHIGRYDAFARFMANNGFAVVGNSHLGHGQSASETDRGFFADNRGWDTVVEDLYLLYETTKTQYPGKPYFLLGHSMGSFLTRTFLIRYPGTLTGCIISGTGQQANALLNAGLALAAIERRLFGARRQSARLNLLCFGAYNRRIPNHRTPNDWLTRDSELVDKFTADDACGWVPTVGIFADLLGGIKFIGSKKNIAKMQKDLPILFISGREDPVGDYGVGVEKVYRLFKEAGIKDVTLKLYDGGRHEMLNETNREEVYNDVLAWINNRMPHDID